MMFMYEWNKWAEGDYFEVVNKTLLITKEFPEILDRSHLQELEIVFLGDQYETQIFFSLTYGFG